MLGRVTYDIFIQTISPVSVSEQIPHFYPCKSSLPPLLGWKFLNPLVAYTSIVLNFEDSSFSCSLGEYDVICNISQNYAFKSTSTAELAFFIGKNIVQRLNVFVQAECPSFRSIVPTSARISGGTPLYVMGDNYSKMNYSLFFSQECTSDCTVINTTFLGCLSPRCSPGFYTVSIMANSGRYSLTTFEFHVGISIISVETVSLVGTLMIKVGFSMHHHLNGALCKVGKSIFEAVANSTHLLCPRGDPGFNTSVCVSMNSGYDWSNCLEVLSAEPSKRELFSFSCVVRVSPQLRLYQTAFVNITVPIPSNDYRCLVSFVDSKSHFNMVVPVVDNFCSFNASHIGSVAIDVTRFNITGCSAFSVIHEDIKCSVTSSSVTLGDFVFILCPPNVPVFDSCLVNNIEIPVQVISNGLFSCAIFNISSGEKHIQLISSSGHKSSSSQIYVYSLDRIHSVHPTHAYMGFEASFVFTGNFTPNKQYSCFFTSRMFSALLVSTSELFCLVQIPPETPAISSLCISSPSSNYGCIHDPYNISIRHLPEITEVKPAVISSFSCRPISIKLSFFMDDLTFILKVERVVVTKTSINRSSGSIDFTHCFSSIGKHEISVLFDGNSNLRVLHEIAVIHSPSVMLVQPSLVRFRSETSITVTGFNLHHIDASLCKVCDKMIPSTFSSSKLVVCPAPAMLFGANCSISISNDGTYFPSSGKTILYGNLPPVSLLNSVIISSASAILKFFLEVPVVSESFFVQSDSGFVSHCEANLNHLNCMIPEVSNGYHNFELIESSTSVTFFNGLFQAIPAPQVSKVLPRSVFVSSSAQMITLFGHHLERWMYSISILSSGHLENRSLDVKVLSENFGVFELILQNSHRPDSVELFAGFSDLNVMLFSFEIIIPVPLKSIQPTVVFKSTLPQTLTFDVEGILPTLSVLIENRTVDCSIRLVGSISRFECSHVFDVVGDFTVRALSLIPSVFLVTVVDAYLKLNPFVYEFLDKVYLVVDRLDSNRSFSCVLPDHSVLEPIHVNSTSITYEFDLQSRCVLNFSITLDGAVISAPFSMAIKGCNIPEVNALVNKNATCLDLLGLHLSSSCVCQYDQNICQFQSPQCMLRQCLLLRFRFYF
jgi:hypothetical protein